MFKLPLLFLFLFILVAPAASQRDFYESLEFTYADTLRGMLRPERTCYDVTFYEIDISIDPRRRYISGYVDIHYRALRDFERLQIDLFANMSIRSIEWNGMELPYERQFNAVFVQFPKQAEGVRSCFRVNYEGQPHTATRPPWDGGFVWARDGKNNPWAAVACEGFGASSWWPNKDHLSDEPDSLSIRVAVPDPLICVSNGNPRGTKALDNGFTRYDWFVSYPINNYNVTVNIGHYAHFSDVYTAADGDKLSLDYYVLHENLEKAKKHFTQVPQTLACFEQYFGKYPFWNDGFALVETPYLGMEHQSAIAYGNRYQRGYLGGMIPRHMNWDYIIVHETGHEYFGNSVSCNDLSEMWIHESFTTYMEALFVECAYNYEEAVDYLAGQRAMIANREPILGPPHVNFDHWDYSDHYYKGAWLLHTLRHAIGKDETWFDLLRAFYEQHAIGHATTADFIRLAESKSGLELDAVFEQYLWYPSIPTLEYKLVKKGKNLAVTFRWNADVKGFNLPVWIGQPGQWQSVAPTDQWQTKVLNHIREEDFQVGTDYFLVDALKK